MNAHRFGCRTNAQLACAAVALVITACPALADIIYVDDSAIGGANDGSSWEDAFVDLQSALAIAQGGDELRIAQGLYKPSSTGDVHAAFQLVDGTLMQGGYAGLGAKNPNALDPAVFVTTFSGDLAADDTPGSFANYADNSKHVVTGAAGIAVEMRGLTIRSGNAVPGFPPDTSSFGGGFLLADDSAVTFVDCIIEDNRALNSGGGIYRGMLHMRDCIVRRNRLVDPTGQVGGVWSDSGSTFTDCVFEENVAPTAGYVGALQASDATLTRCRFLMNAGAEECGAVRGTNLAFIDCEFTGNAAAIASGAIDVAGTTHLTRCHFRDNQSEAGGALSATGTLEARQCTFADNRGSHSAAARCSTGLFIDCLFDSNRTPNLGHEVGALSGGDLTLLNCAFMDNFAVDEQGAVHAGQLLAVNCLFAGNRTNFGSSSALAVTGACTLLNCTFIGNRAATSISAAGGALCLAASTEATVINCIFWENSRNQGVVDQTAQIMPSSGVTLDIHNCNVHGWDGTLGGLNNSGDNPRMLDADGGDDVFGTLDDNPRLSAASPARDTGDNGAIPVDDFDLDNDDDTREALPIDFDGRRRWIGAAVDRGAFEFYSCPADFVPPADQGDGEVDTDELISVISNWGACPQPCPPVSGCPADVVPNCAVDVDDLIAVVLGWGACE